MLHQIQNNNLQANVNPVNNNNGRGAPPPIPKNKPVLQPVIPPKSGARESLATRAAAIISKTKPAVSTTHHLAPS